MTTATTANTVRRKADAPPSNPPLPGAPPVASETVKTPERGAPDLAPVVAALARTVQAALAAVAADIGRGAQSRNGALVALGAHRDDVETLRAFLAAQPPPAYLKEA